MCALGTKYYKAPTLELSLMVDVKWLKIYYEEIQAHPRN